MFRNRKFIIALCVVLCAALYVLMMYERRSPELGYEWMHRLLGRLN